jgi:hypothetical protein
MKKVFILPLLLLPYSQAYSQQWSANTTPTYAELIAHLQKLDKQHREIQLYNMGPSDYGLPIYLCVVNGEKDSLKTFVVSMPV